MDIDLTGGLLANVGGGRLMWITPKTDWTAQDFLDLEVDFSRIEGNIHELLLTVQDYGCPLTLDEKNRLDKTGLFDSGGL